MPTQRDRMTKINAASMCTALVVALSLRARRTRSLRRQLRPTKLCDGGKYDPAVEGGGKSANCGIARLQQIDRAFSQVGTAETAARMCPIKRR